MTMLGNGIRSLALERAELSRSIETIKSEVTESVADNIFESVAHQYFVESADDGMDPDEDINDFIDDLPDEDVDKEIEIENILDADDDYIDIDDIIGVSE